MTEPMYGTTKAAERLGEMGLKVSEETLRRWAEEKRIRHIKLPSGQLRFRQSDLLAILEPVEPEAS